MRGPDSDQDVSMSSCSRVPVSRSFDTPQSTNSKSKQGPDVGSVGAGPEGEKNQDNDVLRSIELIRELSFDTSLSQIHRPDKIPCSENIVSSSTNPSQLPSDVSDNADHSNVAEESEPSPPDRSSPPLSQKINRLGGLQHITDLSNQILFNRNRTRSTSISEMSDSDFNEFVPTAEAAFDEFIPTFISTEEASLKSSRSRNSCSGSSEDEETSFTKKEFVAIENKVSSSPKLLLRPPVSLLNRGRSSTIASDQSSYVSSCSSSSHISDGSWGPVEDTAPQCRTGVEDQCLNQDAGHWSLHEGKCNGYQADISTELSKLELPQPRLTSDALREWDALCQEDLSERGITVNNQFIFRALSCPDLMNLPERRRKCFTLQEVDDEPREVHLLATNLSHLISPSLFSYTNSCAASTISSENNDLQEVASDLDFDMEFMHSCSVEKSSVGTLLDGVDKLNNKSHRRSVSTGSRSGNLLAIPKSTVHQEHLFIAETATPNHRHRRVKSDGSIFCKKQTMLSQIDFGFLDKPSFKSKCNKRHHRGQSLCSFKRPHSMDGSPSFCKKQTMLSQRDFGFLDKLFFKSKYSIRHRRGQSLGSFKEPHTVNGSPLQCILEEANEFPSVCLLHFPKEYLEKLTVIQVLQLGVLLGLFVGWNFSWAARSLLNNL